MNEWSLLYSVSRSPDGAYGLTSTAHSGSVAEIRKTMGSVSLDLAPATVVKRRGANLEPQVHVICGVHQVHVGQSESKSPLRDNGLFLLGENLQEVALRKVELWPLHEFLASHQRIGKVEPAPDELIPSDMERGSYGLGFLQSSSPGTDSPPEFEPITCAIGLPGDSFEEILSLSLRGGQIDVTLRAWCAFHTLAASFDTPREILFLGDELISMDVLEVATSFRVA
jgi:hypothetical protein